MNKNLHAEAMTKSGVVVTEINEQILNEANNIRMLYFTNGQNVYGVSQDLRFFINRHEFDFNLKGQRITRFFQYKTMHHNLMASNENISYHLGIDTEDGNYAYTYTMNIEDTVTIIAQKKENGVVIDERGFRIG